MEGRRPKVQTVRTQRGLVVKQTKSAVVVALVFVGCNHFGRGIGLVGYDSIIAMEGRAKEVDIILSKCFKPVL
ncbi:10340_t:CDS:2, partial [Entrophospora sp. SA101]